MTDQAADLNAWIATNTVRRLDEQNRFFGATAWADGASSARPLNQTTEVHGAYEITDEWAMLEADGYYQAEDGRLKLAPVLVYPGVVLAPWVEGYTVPPRSAFLWLTIEHVLGTARYPTADPERPDTGWSGQITSTRGRLEWGSGEHREQQIFLGGYKNSMPPASTFIWHQIIGSTDAGGRYTPQSLSSPTYVAGFYCPPY